MPLNLIARCALRRAFEPTAGRNGHIVEPSAFRTLNVIVLVRSPVESHLPSAELDFPKEPALRQQLQIAINGPEANVWKTPTHQSVDFIGRGVGRVRLDCFQQGAPLARHPEFRGFASILFHNSNHS